MGQSAVRQKHVLLVLFSTLVLAACSGGGGDGGSASDSNNSGTSASLPAETLRGVLNPNFGSGGILNGPQVIGAMPIGMALNGSDKIDLIYFNSMTPSYEVFQYNLDGSVDTGFGISGNNTFSCTDLVGSENCNVQNILVQGDGKILLVGTESSSGSTNLFAVRLANGSIDTSYGTSGAAVVSFPDLGVTGTTQAVVESSSGNLAIASTAGVTVNGKAVNYPAMARLLPSGQLDNSFGTSGELTVTQAVPGTNQLGVSTFSVGFTYSSHPQAFYLAYGTIGASVVLMRVTAKGSLDTTFGSDGYAFTGEADIVTGHYGLAVQPFDGSILIRDVSSIQRFTRNGNLDSSFGENGSFHFSGTNLNIGSMGDLLVEPSGDILLSYALTGYITLSPPTIVGESIVQRILPDGTLDTTFGNSGTFNTGDTTSNIYEAIGSLLLPDGKLLLLSENSTGNAAFIEIE